MSEIEKNQQNLFLMQQLTRQTVVGRRDGLVEDWVRYCAVTFSCGTEFAFSLAYHTRADFSMDIQQKFTSFFFNVPKRAHRMLGGKIEISVMNNFSGVHLVIFIRSSESS